MCALLSMWSVFGMFLLCVCGGVPHIFAALTYTSGNITYSYHAPTFPYLDPTLIHYNVTARVMPVTWTKCEHIPNQLPKVIILLTDYDLVDCYLESVIRRCRDAGAVGVIINPDARFPNVPGVFDFSDGSGYSSGGFGLTIPLVSISRPDAVTLISTCQLNPNLTITLTSGDSNPFSDIFYSTIWTAQTVVQNILAWGICIWGMYRASQWYKQYRATREISVMAVVSLILECSATALRGSVPNPCALLLGKHHYYGTYGLVVSPPILTGLVDVLIVCYFAEVLHNVRNTKSKSYTFIHQYRHVFFGFCVFVVILVAISFAIGSLQVMNRILIFTILYIVYGFVLIGSMIILIYMSCKIIMFLSSSLRTVQPQRRNQAGIRVITLRVMATCVGSLIIIVFTLQTLSPDRSAASDFILNFGGFLGYHVLSLTHIETFRARSSSDETSATPSSPPRLAIGGGGSPVGASRDRVPTGPTNSMPSPTQLNGSKSDGPLSSRQMPVARASWVEPNPEFQRPSRSPPSGSVSISSAAKPQPIHVLDSDSSRELIPMLIHMGAGAGEGARATASPECRVPSS